MTGFAAQGYRAYGPRWAILAGMRFTTLALFVIWLAGCGGSGPAETAASEGVDTSSLREALTLYASFDDGWDAAFAKGDRRIYYASSYDDLADRAPAYLGTDIETAEGEGKFGHALRFKVKNDKALFYSGDQNVAFTPGNWSGTVSFWLKVDPATELAPGFCDPIQVTDSAYNDNAVWVDFTKDEPRKFRLGVFGELDAWAKDLDEDAQRAKFDARLVVVDPPPFSAQEWTHVAVTWDGVGTEAGQATLYLNGEWRGTATGISEPVGWDMSMATVRLGVNYVGMYDELSLFNRALTVEEVGAVKALPRGIASLLE